ncbi:FAD-dependent oxidoreductase [Halarcobacter ebronensis]|uniref:UDP-galactopyranose mutase n=1 Tax=Halarcobacter ebronensis TaxID=1462615 RepID=A0A4Q1ALJ0_9BACT|nr:FAD-dependent oxidoreductase [Halarcobacter ebronensis]QKF83312.1 UDP-galactopyranose mutase [Halarcobacter ebronensis]RXK05874.1 UDP-galactopyranose mutase [Halarcobacter ebronensis]
MQKTALIIGGGFAGCTAAYMLKEKGFKVTLIEGSSLLGGGCRTFFYGGHPYTYGPHHLLINKDEMYVWEYFEKFLNLRELKHHCLTYVENDQAFYNYPIHIDDVESMPDYEKIKFELENKEDVSKANNFEEYWINSIGTTLYDKFIHSYSEKMWKIKNNTELDEFAFSPKGKTIQSGSKQCFVDQKNIAYPIELDGYNTYFDKCVDGTNVILNQKVEIFDFENKRVKVNSEWISADVIVNTASLDSVFEYCYGELRYIGRDFQKIILPIENVFPEPYHFIHYSGEEPYTRIVEYKKMTGYKSPHTLIGIETPSLKNKLYPYPIKSEINKADKYKELFPKDCYTLGRMGTYHYDNMDIIVKECMELMKRI